MFKRIVIAIFCTLPWLFAAHAKAALPDLGTELNAGLTYQEAVRAVLESCDRAPGCTIQDAVTAMLSSGGIGNDPRVTEQVIYATINARPDDASEIAGAAIRANPQQGEAISRGAVNATQDNQGEVPSLLAAMRTAAEQMPGRDLQSHLQMIANGAYGAGVPRGLIVAEVGALPSALSGEDQADIVEVPSVYTGTRVMHASSGSGGGSVSPN